MDLSGKDAVSLKGEWTPGLIFENSPSRMAGLKVDRPDGVDGLTCRGIIWNECLSGHSPRWRWLVVFMSDTVNLAGSLVHMNELRVLGHEFCLSRSGGESVLMWPNMLEAFDA